MCEQNNKHHTAFIALGSNLNEPLKQLQNAIASISASNNIKIIKQSSWYQNPAIGPGEQDDYLNGVIKVSTTLEPIELLNFLQSIENQQGRTRGEIRWQARPLDLDILLYADQTIDTERLEVPHPRMQERAFVIFPLHEIEPELVLPDNTAVKQLISELSDKMLEKLELSR